MGEAREEGKKGREGASPRGRERGNKLVIVSHFINGVIFFDSLFLYLLILSKILLVYSTSIKINNMKKKCNYKKKKIEKKI